MLIYPQRNGLKHARRSASMIYQTQISVLAVLYYRQLFFTFVCIPKLSNQRHFVAEPTNLSCHVKRRNALVDDVRTAFASIRGLQSTSMLDEMSKCCEP